MTSMPVVAICSVATGAFALHVYDEVVNWSSSSWIGAQVVHVGQEDVGVGVC